MLTRFEYDGKQSGRRFFLLIHGMEHTAANLAQVREAICEAFPADRIASVTYPSSRWSNANPIEIAKECVAAIQADFERHSDGGYQEIILVGHSLGALLARKICLLAHGICSDFPTDVPVRPAPQPWANRIKRLVLLAGMSRGWRLRPRNPHTPWFRWLGRALQLVIARIFARGRLVRAAHRGSPFIVNLRLDWLALVNGDYPAEISPEVVVQLAGTHDTVVHPQDHYDLQAGRNFKYFSIEETSHHSVILFKDTKRGLERKRALLHALQTDPEQFSGALIPEVESPDFSVTKTILLVHGIRDYGKWPEDLSTLLHEGATARNLRIATEIHNYGYLALLPFLFGIRRSVHVERFMDRYADVRSQYPRATCSFVGHSNGTYLLASSLRRYQAPRFERVAFAGSIVQRNFPWRKQFQHRVGKLRNYVASADATVAVFPSLFEMLRTLPLLHGFPLNRDFGSAGHTGFVQVNEDFRNVTFIEGDHGAALKPEHRGTTVSFLLGDSPAQRVVPHVVDKQSSWIVLAHKACVLIWIGMIAICGLFFYASVWANSACGWRLPILPVAVIILYFLFFFRY